MKLTSLDWVAFILVILGGLNWGSIGFFGGYNFVVVILGSAVGLYRYVNMAIGLGAIYLAVTMLPKITKK